MTKDEVNVSCLAELTRYRTLAGSIPARRQAGAQITYVALRAAVSYALIEGGMEC